MSRMTFKTTVLNPAEATADALVLDDPLSFWGGFNPRTGEIIDRLHPQVGASIAGVAMVIPASRGSAGTPAGVAEAIRRGSGPSAILLGRPDVNITIGAMVADRLYGTSTPVFVLDPADYATIRTGDTAEMQEDGTVTVTPAPGESE